MSIRSHVMSRSTAAMAVVAAGSLVAGCGSSGNSSSSTAAATPPPAATTAAAPAATTPAAAAGGGITVDASEFKFAPTALSAKAGKVKITLDNKGQVPHEFIVLKTSQPAGSLKVSGGRVSEADSVGEISETDGGAKASHTFDLKPGTYVYVCNIPGHYGDGMRGTLTVK